MRHIPLAIPNMSDAEATNLQKCITDNFVSSVGPFVTELETRIAALSGVKDGVAMGAGTQALHMALHALGIGRGDLVILPSFTFIASANAIAHSGAQPWLFDIEIDSWTLDPAQVAEALRSETTRDSDGTLRHTISGKRVAAIMPVYTLGTPADMDALGVLAKQYKLPIVADAAAAIGVTYKGVPIGRVANLTCYSFNGNKTITCGGGGMVVGDGEPAMRDIRHISTTARVSPNYDHDRVGYNYRMTNVQAAIGCAQTDRLEGFLATKQAIRERYDAAFSGLNSVTRFPSPHDRTSTYWFSGFVLGSRSKSLAAKICKQLNSKGIEARTFWKPVHLQVPYADAPTASQTVTDALWQRIVTLPCSTNLTEADQARVIKAVHETLIELDA